MKISSFLASLTYLHCVISNIMPDVKQTQLELLELIFEINVKVMGGLMRVFERRKL